MAISSHESRIGRVLKPEPAALSQSSPPASGPPSIRELIHGLRSAWLRLEELTARVDL